VLVYLEGDKPPPPRHAEFRQTFLENLAKSQLEFEEVRNTISSRTGCEVILQSGSSSSFSLQASKSFFYYVCMLQCFNTFFMS
jgi:hypothetical protein